MNICSYVDAADRNFTNAVAWVGINAQVLRSKKRAGFLKMQSIQTIKTLSILRAVICESEESDMYKDMNGTEIELGAKVRIFENEDFKKQCCPRDFINHEYHVEKLIYDKYVVIRDWFFPTSCLRVVK